MNLKRKAGILFLITVLLLSTTGCIHEELTYQFNKDGTGNLSVLLTMAETYSDGTDESEDSIFGITDSDLSNLEGMTFTQTPLEETINGEKFVGTKIEMFIPDMDAFLSTEGGDTLKVVNLANGNKRLEFVMSTEETTGDPIPQTPEQQAQTIAAMKALNTKIALNIKTDYKVVNNNATSVANGLYTWDLLEMAMNTGGTAEPACYIEYVPINSTSIPSSVLPAQNVKALPTTSKVMVNSKEIEFDAYNINGNNYFKLRDVAAAIKGSEKQFGVEWDDAKNAINLTSNGIYKIVGGELVEGDGIIKTGKLNAAPIYKDGTQVKLNAYNINGNNYFKLRDLGASFNMGVAWDSKAKTIGIDTSTSYTE